MPSGTTSPGATVPAVDHLNGELFHGTAHPFEPGDIVSPTDTEHTGFTKDENEPLPTISNAEWDHLTGRNRRAT